MPRIARLLGIAALGAAAAVAPGLPAHAVAHGVDASDGAYPFAVKLTMTDIPKASGGTYDSGCSGALISARWVITAGHCFHDINRKPVSGPTPYPTTATIGRTDASDDDGHVVKVVEVRQDPDADISLGKLAEPVTDITPLALSTAVPSEGQKLTLAGWGATSADGPPATRLQIGTVSVISVDERTVEVVGASPSKGTSACPYDSGAPYFVADSTTSGRLVSVESNGPDCPHASPETTSRVDTSVTWIRHQIRS